MLTRYQQSKAHLKDALILMQSILNRTNAVFEANIRAMEIENPKEEETARDALFKKTFTKFLSRDFMAWCMFFLPKHFIDESPEFHYEVIDLLFDLAIPKMALAAPRGTAKSTLISTAYPLFNITNELEPNIILISVNESSAKKILLNIKNELIRNERIINFYGMKKSKEVWNETEFIWGDIIMSAFGLGMPVRVSKYGHNRPTLAIIDDIETRNIFTLIQSKNQDEWQQYKDYIYREVEPALDPKVGKVRFIGTIFHPDAILPYMMKSPMYASYKWSIIYTDANGEEKSLWPSRFPIEKLYKVRDELFAQGQADVWMSEYMNEPVGKDTKDFGTVTRYSDAELTASQDNLLYFHAFDLATGKGKDKTASVILARDQEHYNNIYIIDYFEERLEIDEGISKILEQIQKYQPTKTTSQKDLLSTTAEKQFRAEALRRKINLNFSFTTDHQKRSVETIGSTSKRSKDSKRVRIVAVLQPWIKSGKLKVHERHKELIEAIENYPFVKTDDLLDALAEAVHNSFPSDRTDESVSEMERGNQQLAEFLRAYKERIEQHRVESEGDPNFGKWADF